MMTLRPLPFASLLALALTAACNTDYCVKQDVGIGFACVPDTAAPNTTVAIEVREACGTYCAQDPECTATLTGGAVVLELAQDRCGDVQPSSCGAESCTQRIAKCNIPQLPAGDYPLVIPGSGDQILHVREGGQAACHLANTSQ